MKKELKDELKFIQRLIETLKENKIREFKDSRFEIVFDFTAYPSNQKQNPVIVKKEPLYDEPS